MIKGKSIVPINIIFIISLLMISSFGFPSSLLAQEPKVFSNLGLYGGQILDIAIDSSNHDKMFAGSYLGDGLSTTYDGGNHWQAVETNGVIPGHRNRETADAFSHRQH